jgi:hypothetical protein
MIYPTSTFLGYLIITIFYIIFKIFLGSKGLEGKDKISSSSYLSMGIYTLFTTALIMFVNITNSNEKCGPVKIVDAMIYTLIPIILLQFLFMYLLKSHQGWKIPFSNTLGYLITSMFSSIGLLPNIKDTLKYVFKKPKRGKNSDIMDNMMIDDSQFLLNYFTPDTFCEKIVEQKLAGRLDNDILPKINASGINTIKEKLNRGMEMGKEMGKKGFEMGKETFQNTKNKVKGMFGMSGGSLSEDDNTKYKEYIDNCMRENNIGTKYLKPLYLLVLVKDYISEGLLLCLIGFLVITKSYNTIVNFKCAPVNNSKNMQLIKKKQRDFKKEEDDLKQHDMPKLGGGKEQ